MGAGEKGEGEERKRGGRNEWQKGRGKGEGQIPFVITKLVKL